MNAPKTLLSFLFHSTIPRYRDEMHLDLEDAYRRFGLDQSLDKLGLAPSVAKELRVQIEKVDVAAYKLRRQDDVPQAATEMRVSSQAVFNQLAPILDLEIAKGPRVDDDRNLAAQDNFLKKLYLLFYSTTWRQGNEGQTVFGSGFNTGGIGPAWDTVRGALMGNPANTAPSTKILCDRLTKEFNATFWPIIW